MAIVFSEVTAVLSGLAVVTSGLASYFGLRIQRDMARLKADILESLNGKYLTRKEADLLDRERDRWEVSISEHFDSVENLIEKQREGQNELRREFIACRAAHTAGTKGAPPPARGGRT